ncbi:hypothetical protein SCHPADRAFT_966005 [Schizopora paradoxa]|uniref:F-box domain-containing protein n=1 Tax=Schizopora paradoxa TaxID=27342 RepID=A0A0H2RR38_9AGAM|nr:hypothetical protein SCHPADRAFT_966005 [Schizopora paradoxa]
MVKGADSKSNYFQSLSGLCQLPPEALLRVLEVAITVDNVRPEGLPELIFEANNKARSSHVNDIVTLVASTSVCRYWRQLFLGTPTLWRNISAEFHPELVNLFLQRSMSLPLHVVISDGESTKSKRTLKNLCTFPTSYEPRTERYLTNSEVILKSFHRIRLLSITSSQMDTYNSQRPSPRFLRILCDAFDRCSKAGPIILQGIEIDSFWPPPSNSDAELEFVDSVLSRAELSLSSLRRMDLRSTCIPWHFLQSTSQSLTHLSISTIFRNVDGLEGLKSVFERHAALESLALDILIDDAPSIHPPTPFLDNERIVLPVLQKLFLAGDDTSNTSILGMLKLPSLKSICINDKSKYLEGGDDVALTFRQISELELPSASHLCISFEGPWARFDLKELKKGSFASDEEDEVVFTYVYAQQDPLLKSSSIILLSQLQLLNLHSIKHIDIPVFPDSEPSFADKLVRLVPNIESINVYYGHPYFSFSTDRIHSMLRPVEMLWDYKENARFHQVFEGLGGAHLASLRRLIFSGIRMDLNQDRHFFSELFGTLSRRVKVGYPKVVVKFRDCEGIDDVGHGAAES